ncbi:hypothetical protein GO308_15065 [Sphingomonas sp. SFZ2018-12]|uniref:DUF6904 family protein n=1 Tax=Sphingomonas sp. SFZ2018-12 TaxID=2683197 RepID=UPI001F0F647A|nr:hypothetical protein [Sphingomonas sp. SFZ2018-12]MCH4894437.1 hypothetical protein [Sphingomonas sp. SFZ2018-12]
MFQYSLGRNNAGLVVIGDTLTLRDLYRRLHEIAEASPLTRGAKGEFFLGFAYEVRHAMQGDRERFKPQEAQEVGPAFGFRVVWPFLLGIVATMRASMAFFPSTSGQQAVVYSLESMLEDAIRDAFKTRADAVQNAWRQLRPEHDAFLTPLLDARCAAFCSWTKQQRGTYLPALLESTDPMYGKWLYSHKDQPPAALLDPKELESWVGADWPSVRW